MKTIMVNGVENEIEVDTLGYSAIVFLADKEVKLLPTVTYKTKDMNGSLIRGDHVEIEEGMILNVANMGGA